MQWQREVFFMLQRFEIFLSAIKVTGPNKARARAGDTKPRALGGGPLSHVK